MGNYSVVENRPGSIRVMVDKKIMFYITSGIHNITVLNVETQSQGSYPIKSDESFIYILLPKHNISQALKNLHLMRTTSHHW
jgi:hypothetical protein